MEKTIARYEPPCFQRWTENPLKYVKVMMDHIEASRIDVHEIHAKKKLSQNRTGSEIKRIKAGKPRGKHGCTSIFP